MAKAKKTISQVSGEIYDLLESFKAEERARILTGVCALLGDAVPANAGLGGGGSGGGGGGGGGAGGPAPAGSEQELVKRGARAYFDHKNPSRGSEQFGTAARFNELNTSAAVTTKADFQRIISDEARRGFNSTKFARDANNAVIAGFFNRGGSAETGFTLSHIGQKYIDALPDRAAAKALKKGARATVTRPRGKRAKGRAGKAAAS